MELQRILAPNTRRAMEEVYQLYGENALVVSNKKAKKQTEIIVAIDLAAEADPALDTAPANAKQSAREPSSPSRSFDEVMESRIYNSAISANHTEDNTTDANSHLGSRNHIMTTVPEHREHLNAREIVDLVKQELAVMHREFKLSQQLAACNGTLAVADEMRPLIEAFNETGMPIGLRTLIIDLVNQHADMATALANITEVLGSGIKNTALLDEIQGIHLIAGSSGAGKTLMTGRLAKQAALNYGDQAVAIISFNDARFGAWNQSQLVGTQAGVDTFRAANPEMLALLLEEIKSRKLIIIDTPGEDIENQIDALTKLVPKAQKHLILAADAGEASVKRHIRSDGINWDSIMLSRLQAGVYPWAIISILMNIDTPVSVAAAEPSIIDPAVPLSGQALAQHALTHLPISFV